jgi:hypothetical protein
MRLVSLRVRNLKLLVFIGVAAAVAVNLFTAVLPPRRMWTAPIWPPWRAWR